MQRQYDGTVLSTDFQALSLFRIAISVYLLGDFFVSVYPYFDDFYGDSGILPISALAEDHLQPGLHVMLPFLRILDIIQSRTLFAALYSVAAIAFAVGYRTRWSNAVVFVLNGYLYWRNPYIDSGAETLAHLLLLWSLFLPMGRFWSIDAALDQQSRQQPYPVLPFLAMRLQIASLYLFAGLFKVAGLPWRNGSALSWALSDSVFGATAPGQFLIHHAPGLLYIVNYLVIAFQLAFPFLVYCPWRNDLVRAAALAGSAAMHTSFIFFLNVGGFPYVCLAMLLLLFPDTWFDRLLRQRRQRLAALTIYYEPGCGFCQRTSLVLREFLLSPTSAVVPASIDRQVHGLLLANNSWVVHGTDGKFYLKWHAMDYLLRQNPLFAPAGWFLEQGFMQKPMEKLYDLIGSSRQSFATIANVLFPIGSARPIGKPALALCGFLMVLALTSNIFGLARLAFPILRRFDEITAVFQVRQSWEVFAPGPAHYQRNYSVIAHLAGGSTVDLMKLLPTPAFRIDGSARVTFSSPRWVKYYTRFDDLTDADWAAFGHYLCRQAQAHAASGAVVRKMEITAVTQPIDGTPAARTPVEHRVFDCPSAAAAKNGIPAYLAGKCCSAIFSAGRSVSAVLNNSTSWALYIRVLASSPIRSAASSAPAMDL